MNLIDLFDPMYDRIEVPFSESGEYEIESGVCSDDWESSAPMINMLPEESDHEDGSPLDFDANLRARNRIIDRQLAKIL